MLRLHDDNTEVLVPDGLIAKRDPDFQIITIKKKRWQWRIFYGHGPVFNIRSYYLKNPIGALNGHFIFVLILIAIVKPCLIPLFCFVLGIRKEAKLPIKF